MKEKLDIEQKLSESKTPLQYDKYKDYYIENKNNNKKEFSWKNGVHQWLFKFDNDYGASVIKHYGSYGFEDDLFELAVIEFYDNDWDLSYSTPITDNVIGHLTNDEVLSLLERIKNL